MKLKEIWIYRHLPDRLWVPEVQLVQNPLKQIQEM